MSSSPRICRKTSARARAWPAPAAWLLAAAACGSGGTLEDAHLSERDVAGAGGVAKAIEAAHAAAPAAQGFLPPAAKVRAYPLSAGLLARDLAWFNAAEEGHAEAATTLARAVPDGDVRLENLGLRRGEKGSVERLPGAHRPAPMVNFRHPDMPHIDCIAIASVGRGEAGTPAVLTTLAALFAALPEGIEVNVVVDEDGASELGTEQLAAHLPPAQLAHVHVWAPTAAPRSEGPQTFSPTRRQALNYGRLLLSYTGSRGLLALESHALWATGATADLARLAAEERVAALSLHSLARADLVPVPHSATPRIDIDPDIGQAASASVSLRGVLYAPSVVAGMGRFVQLRAHQGTHASQVVSFLQAHGLPLGTTRPSLVL